MIFLFIRKLQKLNVHVAEETSEERRTSLINLSELELVILSEANLHGCCSSDEDQSIKRYLAGYNATNYLV